MSDDAALIGESATGAGELEATAAAVRLAREESALDQAISADRLATYLAAANGDRALARALYVWDRDLSIAILADIAILEVAMRNAMHLALSSVWGQTWYENPKLELDDRTLRQLRTAWEDLPNGVRRNRLDPRLPGRLVARCMFGFWANLLDAGDHFGSEPRRYRVDYEFLWRNSLHQAFRGGAAVARAEHARYTRPWAHEAVRTVNALRNRVAHHEPLINGFPLPGQGRRLTAKEGHQACRKLAQMIDRDLATWLDRSSMVPTLLGSQPTPV
ncbi:hypothetical protein [Leifsonia sp. 2MCAF36]|uniref:hypothetical protein n=1 Tax=Leifsonia sp. 2MCAF36 TaxID=3232988 RepID=UPI003F99D0BE